MDTESVNSVMDRIGGAVEALAESLKVPAERLLEAGMRYVIASAVVDIVVALIFVCASIYLTRLYLRSLFQHRKDVDAGKHGIKRYSSDNRSMTDGWLGFYVSTGIAAAILCAISICLTLESLYGIPILLAPEIGVVKLIGTMF